MADILHKAKEGWCCPKIEDTCAECGKKFKRTDEHVYMRRKNNDVRMFYCSYNCYRVYERQMEAAKPKEEEPEELSEIEQAEKRVALCREKIEEFTKKKSRASTRISKSSAQNGIYNWKRFLKEAEARLEALRGGQA